MRLLVEVLVNEGQNWHHSFYRGCTLVIPQHFILLYARVDRLQERIEDSLVEKLSMRAQTA